MREARSASLPRCPGTVNAFGARTPDQTARKPIHAPWISPRECNDEARKDDVMSMHHRNVSSRLVTYFTLVFGGVAICAASFTTSVAAQATSTACQNEGPADFVDLIDNQYFPLRPGTTFTYNGLADGQPARTVTQVTNDTNVIQGVRTTVVHDVLYINGVLSEDTFDWYAQDKAGNVCYFGEDTKELDASGNVTSTEGSWQAGKNGAVPGAIMLADPQPGVFYKQEFAAGVAEDEALVISRTKDIKVTYGSFRNVLLTRETTPLEPGSIGDKYYAPNVGLIAEVAKKGGRERFDLVSITARQP